MFKKILPIFLVASSFVCSELTPLPRYNWRDVMAAPAENATGNQILHFNSSNKPIKESHDAIAFKETYFYAALECKSDAEVLRAASDWQSVSGAIIEVGTKAGKNANFLAALNPHKKIVSFDTNGLPMHWKRDDFTMLKGAFAYKDANAAPPVLHNVHLYRGDYAEMLSQLDDTPISLLHVDCEIYESTVVVLKALSHKIVSGTIIVFDEAYNYPGSERHEWKAFLEFCDREGIEFEAIAYNSVHEQVAVFIK